MVDTAEPDWAEGDTWRDRNPEFAHLPDLISINQVAELIGVGRPYARILRDKRTKLDNMGKRDPCVMALPTPSPLTTDPLMWATEEIITWGRRTGRLDPITGKARRLWSPGAPKKNG